MTETSERNKGMNYQLLNGMRITGPLTAREKKAITNYVIAYYDQRRFTAPIFDLEIDMRTVAKIPEVA